MITNCRHDFLFSEHNIPASMTLQSLSLALANMESIKTYIDDFVAKYCFHAPLVYIIIFPQHKDVHHQYFKIDDET